LAEVIRTRSSGLPFGLAYLPHPAKLPEIAVSLFWHAKLNKDPANQWRREAVVRLHADADSE